MTRTDMALFPVLCILLPVYLFQREQYIIVNKTGSREAIVTSVIFSSSTEWSIKKKAVSNMKYYFSLDLSVREISNLFLQSLNSCIWIQAID